MSEFVKMHGAGNDFIVADNRSDRWSHHTDFIRKICDRHRGIGADGLILLSAPSASPAQVKMSFFNNDGLPAEMCGNGLRCAALFASRHLGEGNEIVFETVAGLLKTRVLNPSAVEIEIPVLHMPEKIKVDGEEGYCVNTGVPHLVLIKDGIEDIDVAVQGRELRNHIQFKPVGTNVNFIAVSETERDPIKIRTYERGVEAETAACGTGIAASALTLGIFFHHNFPIEFITGDGDALMVDLIEGDELARCRKILLTGPAIEVFAGRITI